MNAPRPLPLACDRRQFLRTAMSASLGLAIASTPLGAVAASGRQPPGGESWLLVIPDTNATGYYSGTSVSIFDPDGQELAALDVPGISGTIIPTGDPRLAIVEMWKAVTLLHLDPPSAQMVDYRFPEGQVMFVADPRGRSGESHPRWSLITILGDIVDPAMTPRVVLLDLARAAGTDLVPFLPTIPQQAPTSHQFAPDGEHIVIWDDLMPSLYGGDPVPASIPRAVLFETADPASNRELSGTEGDWNSGRSAFSPDATLLAYTTYDPDSLEGEIVLEPLAGGDAVTVAAALDLDRAFWLPGGGNRLLTVDRGEVALHEIAADGSVTSTPLDSGDIRADLPVQVAPGGQAVVYGLAEDADAPASWRRLDLVTGDVAALDGLAGLHALGARGVEVRPRWTLFTSDTLTGYDPLAALDLETGEVTQLADLFPRPEGFAASDDGRIAVLDTGWDSQYPASLVNLEEGTLTKLWAAQTQMIRSGVVSPDGARAAIIAVGNADHALETLLIDTAQPDAPQFVSAGAALLWTADR